MAMSVITVANQKGGVGKTNTVINLAVQLEVMGYGPVVLLDTDAPQGTLSGWFNEREQETPAMTTLAPGVSLAAKIKELEAQNYRFLIIDTGPRDPGREPFIAEVIRAADLVLIPTKVSWKDSKALVPTLNCCTQYSKKFLFVMNEVKPNLSLTPQVIAMLSQYGPIAPNFIGSRAAFLNSDVDGLAACELDARGAAALDIQALIKTVLSHLPQYAKPLKEKKRV